MKNFSLKFIVELKINFDKQIFINYNWVGSRMG